jgi:hypothetical protein
VLKTAYTLFLSVANVGNGSVKLPILAMKSVYKVFINNKKLMKIKCKKLLFVSDSFHCQLFLKLGYKQFLQSKKTL